MMKGVENESYLPDDEQAKDVDPEASPTRPASLNNPPEKLMDFDDVLPSVGEFGTYQIILFFLTAPFCFFLAFTYFSQMFITLVPDHWCHVPQLNNSQLSIQQRRELSIPLVEHPFLGIGAKPSFDKCNMYDVDYDDVLLNNLRPNSSWKTKACSNGWDYDFERTKYPTIVSEYNWVCEDAGKPPLAQSLFFAGAFIGGIISGYTADRFGRLPALILCNMFCAVAGVLTFFSYNFPVFAFSRFVMGMGFDNCFTLMYILVLEYVGPKYRTLAGNLAIALFYTAGTTLVPWIAWGISDWRMFSLAMAIPTFLVVLAYWVVPESPRWLLSQGKYDKAFSILRKFARINKKQVDESVYKKLKDSAEEAKRLSANTPTPTVLDLLRTPRLRRNTILLTLLWVVIALVYDGHAKNTANLGLSVFLTSSIACSTELPADLVVVFFLDRWGRRALAFGSLLGAAIFSLICVGIPVEHAALAAGLAIVGRFCVNITLNIGHQYGAELIPTSVRAQGISYVHMAGYIASLVSPYIVDLARFNRVLPLIVLGLLAFFGAIVGFLLPETMGATLPQTMEEGENFGRDQSLWDFPCCSRRRRRRQEKTTDTKTPQALPASVTNIVESSQPTILQLNHKRID